MLDAYWAAPPVSRTLTALVLLISVSTYSHLLGFHRIFFAWEHIFKFPPEIWRFVTAFCLSGGQLAIIFDPYFIWQYASDLETNSPRLSSPGDFFIYIVFVCSVILVLSHHIMGNLFFTPALIIALAYTFGQENRGKKVQFIIITIDVKYLPYAIMFLNLIINGLPSFYAQLAGIPAAHSYDFLTRMWPEFGGGRSIIWTPRFVAGWFGDGSRITVGRHGTVFRPPVMQSTSTYSSGWSARGQGRRLGGD